MDDSQRQRFDRVLDRVYAALPENVRALLEEAPLIVEDHPSRDIAQEMELESLDELCGLHDGIAITEQSVEDAPTLPTTITIYRLGLIALVRESTGGWDEEELAEQIRITILHEVGHHFGLDEDQLDDLGFG